MGEKVFENWVSILLYHLFTESMLQDDHENTKCWAGAGDEVSKTCSPSIKLWKVSRHCPHCGGGKKNCHREAQGTWNAETNISTLPRGKEGLSRKSGLWAEAWRAAGQVNCKVSWGENLCTKGHRWETSWRGWEVISREEPCLTQTM